MAIRLADTARPNNYVDAEHKGTFPVAYAEDIWFEDGTRLSEKSFDGQSIQKEELPLASADELGNIYQYVGETGTYTNGHFYKCILNSSVYSWSEIKMVEKPVVYSETVPDINAYETGSIVCYTGEDSGSFEKGHLYKKNETITEGDWVDIGGGSKLDNVFLVKDSEGAATLAVSQRTFTGTQAEWDALTIDKKKTYNIINITDDESEANLDYYSTTETKTNKVWIDGKPIYRKCGHSSVTQAEKNLDSTLTNNYIDTVINVYGTLIYYRAKVVVYGYSSEDTNLRFKVDTDGLKQGSNNYSISDIGSDLYWTIEYTKTTD